MTQQILGVPVSPELRLLLACAAGAPLQHLRGLLDTDFDWNFFHWLTEKHQLLPTVRRALEPLGFDLPAEVGTRLTSDFANHARRTLMLSRELLRALEALESQGVDAIPFKGPALAISAYGDVAARTFSDVDILIRPRDFERAAAALVAGGYRTEMELRPALVSRWVRTSYELAFARDELRHVVELQWGLAPAFYGFGCDVEELFTRARTATIFGESVPTISAEDQLLAVAVHGGKHLWWQLRWLCDLKFAANVPGIDWSAVLGRARRWRVERIVRVGVHLAQSLLAAEFPAAVVRWVKQDAMVEQIGRGLAGTIFAAQEIPADSFAYFRWMGRLRERGFGRARFFWKLAMTPSVGEWEAVRLPRVLFPLYRVVRVVRLLRRVAG
jgi:hypothetical protein